MPEDTEIDTDRALLLRRHESFALCVALFQVSIALGAVAALTRNRLVWYGSLAVGLAGAGVLVARLVA